jgi:hypothetical protein
MYSEIRIQGYYKRIEHFQKLTVECAKRDIQQNSTLGSKGSERFLYQPIGLRRS